MSSNSGASIPSDKNGGKSKSRRKGKKINTKKNYPARF
jgi:hypothetical protein